MTNCHCHNPTGGTSLPGSGTSHVCHGEKTSTIPYLFAINTPGRAPRTLSTHSSSSNTTGRIPALPPTRSSSASAVDPP